MRRALLITLLVPVMAITVQVQPALAHAPNCGGLAPLQLTCTVRHSPWTWIEPEPDVWWSTGYTGTIEAKIIGDFGATKIKICNITAGIANCSIPRDDHMQCCTESWTLMCTASGVGQWSCSHDGG